MNARVRLRGSVSGLLFQAVSVFVGLLLTPVILTTLRPQGRRTVMWPVLPSWKSVVGRLYMAPKWPCLQHAIEASSMPDIVLNRVAVGAR